MTTDLDQLLGSYSASDYSVRLINGLCAVVPFAESPGTWFTVSDGLKQAHPEAKKSELVRVLALSNEPGPQRALWIFNAIDKADSGIGVVSGVASAYKLYQAKDGDDPQPGAAVHVYGSDGQLLTEGPSFDVPNAGHPSLVSGMRLRALGDLNGDDILDLAVGAFKSGIGGHFNIAEYVRFCVNNDAKLEYVHGLSRQFAKVQMPAPMT